MSKLAFYLKNNSRRILRSPSVGYVLKNIPYSLRPGIARSYIRETKRLEKLDNMTKSDLTKWRLSETKEIASYAFQYSDFYRCLYRANGLSLDSIQKLHDVRSLPIVTKGMLQSASFNSVKCQNTKTSLRVNTGGTSGTPLSFSISSNQLGVEWANLHFFFKRWGLKWNTTRICFVGQVNLRSDLEYDVIRDAYFINTYKNISQQIESLLEIFHRNPNQAFILHGYPSLVYEVVNELNHGYEIEVLRERICGVLLCSEFAPLHIRNEISATLGSSCFCFYGHSERACIAQETEENSYIYEASSSYGLTESVEDELVATSFHNVAFPFIRYNTGDRIRAFSDSNTTIIDCFAFDEGRASDFVLDLDKNKIQLTALIFGRHHKIFEDIYSLQVLQEEPGLISLYIVPKSHQVNSELIDKLDFKNVGLGFTLYALSQPVLTDSGKLKIKLDEAPSGAIFIGKRV
ncbi:phenylacetate-CoA ligase [Pseudidiomarina maritima]|uniref:Phenylacetate-CoA ligase n=1 Tax=Pseudidiomarina maritima TaxID=519453 RepID=A0A1I6GRQ4_9GAMM|nr:hypothetical protein [Pseudidiomarina maritima]SFR44860.1 phenylacetate-CoA ligase [Pseudidiomarina maritima]